MLVHVSQRDDCFIDRMLFCRFSNRAQVVNNPAVVSSLLEVKFLLRLPENSSVSVAQRLVVPYSIPAILINVWLLVCNFSVAHVMGTTNLRPIVH